MLSLLFIGFTEIMVVMVVVLVVFGPSKIPEIARGLGEGIRYLRASTDSIKTEIMKEVDQDGSIQDIQNEINGFKHDIQDVKGSFSRDFTPRKKEENKEETTTEEPENSTFQRVKMDIEEAKEKKNNETPSSEIIDEKPNNSNDSNSETEPIEKETTLEDKTTLDLKDSTSKPQAKAPNHSIPGTVSRDY